MTYDTVIHSINSNLITVFILIFTFGVLLVPDAPEELATACASWPEGLGKPERKTNTHYLTLHTDTIFVQLLQTVRGRCLRYTLKAVEFEMVRFVNL